MEFIPFEFRYKFINGLVSSDDQLSGIQFYFYDTNEELACRVESCDKYCESTVELLMNILQDNPYTKFFKSLLNIPGLENHRIVLNCNFGLYK